MVIRENLYQTTKSKNFHFLVFHSNNWKIFLISLNHSTFERYFYTMLKLDQLKQEKETTN